MSHQRISISPLLFLRHTQKQSVGAAQKNAVKSAMVFLHQARILINADNDLAKISSRKVMIRSRFFSLNRLQIAMLNFEVLQSLNCSHDWHETSFIWKGVCCGFILQSVIIPIQVVWLPLDVQKTSNFQEKHWFLLFWSRQFLSYPISFLGKLT